MKGDTQMSKILVVDDESMIRVYICAILEEHGYEVVPAVDGQDGLEKFLAEKDKIDLVITDYKMPNKCGTEMAHEIWKVKDVRIIFVSGHEEILVTRSRSLPSGFLHKPFSAGELFQKVQEIFKEK